MKTLIIINIVLTLAVGYIALSANTHAYNAAWALMQILESAPGQDS